MDIAKYMTTAFLLSTIFSDYKESVFMMIFILIAIIITLGWGLWLVRDKKKKED